ncbi:hypothetical protein Pcinc_012818 [Petrolisthes cinctipes]|uniref:Uncharacterized protein n=1 Tax=Petrolisthes cinctipes TaxID=88211 RepID=A0AAE1KSZ8_PETCI|nr:hypothetical protein Pcinc_012818 [Petrolisthes cinctipes]
MMPPTPPTPPPTTTTTLRAGVAVPFSVSLLRPPHAHRPQLEVEGMGAAQFNPCPTHSTTPQAAHTPTLSHTPTSTPKPHSRPQPRPWPHSPTSHETVCVPARTLIPRPPTEEVCVAPYMLPTPPGLPAHTRPRPSAFARSSSTSKTQVRPHAQPPSTPPSHLRPLNPTQPPPSSPHAHTTLR